MGHPKPKDQPATPETKTHTNRILIVDDEASSRDLCRLFLEADGYDVETSDQAEKPLPFFPLNGLT